MSLTSRLRSRLSGRQHLTSRRVTSGTALTLVAGVLVAAAVNADGFPITKVDLNDGSVWVSKNSDQIIARLNSQARELDLGVLTKTSDADLRQAATDVQVVDLGGGGNRRVMIVDVAGGVVSKAVEVSKTTDVSAGRRTVALVDQRSGQGWVRPADQLEGFSARDTPTVKGLGQTPLVTVGADGIAYFFSREKRTVTPVSIDVTGAPVVAEAVELDAEAGDDATMTVVDGHPLVLDPATSTVYGTEGSSKVVDGETARLQQPSDAKTSDAYVATSAGLSRGSVTGGGFDTVSEVKVDGPPAAPVVVDGCVYAAWLDPEADKSYEQICADEHDLQRIPDLPASADLVFRVNRSVVVLNDQQGGMAWLVQDGMFQVDNWESIDPRNKQTPKDAVEEERKDSKNKPPEANDDTAFGARAGRTVVLPVTVNDNDPDGDVLTVLPTLESETDDVRLSIVGNGTQVQAEIGSNVRDDVRFTYEVEDGHPENASDSADVTVPIVPADQDEKPTKFENRTNELTVAKGREATVNVLPAWFDPDGDPVVLKGASSKGGEVRTRPDGTVTFRDDGAGGSEKTIDFEVRGGSATAKGTVAVTVVDPAKAAPTTVADRFTGVSGSAILLDPLTNDSDPIGDGMRLVRLEPAAGSTGDLKVTRDAEAGTGTVEAGRPGTYYLEYVAGSKTSPAQAAPQLIRVDVLAVGKVNHPPVADRDTAIISSGESVLVDVLANDSDPDGDVLAVRGFGAVGDGIRASLIDKRFVRVESVAPLGDRQPEVKYLLTDGENTEEGTISVSEGEADENRPPVAQDDTHTVRAGTIITLPILDNDSDPDGDPLSVYGQDLLGVPDDVPVIATGDAVRVKVPDDGSTQLQFEYTARDGDLAGATARVTLNILPDDPEGNEAPKPAPIEARAVAGQKVRVPLSAFDADPDGDPVGFSAVAQQPASGRIVKTGVDWVEYEPYENARGTDTFRVEVSDTYGATGLVDVRVGVAERAPVNQPPTALDDDLFVKPGRTIQYPVRDNDTDPDGDGFSLLPTLQTPEGTEATIVGDFVETTSPDLDGATERSATVQYGVTDRLGGTSQATFTVTSSELAPEHAPIANDDTVPLDDVVGKQPGDTVDVKVLDNDGDIDGNKKELEFEPLEGATKDDQVMRIELTAESQVVPYRLVDRDDQVSFGFVYVSGTDDVAPVLDQSKVPVEVTAGELAKIDLKDIVLVRSGHEPYIARPDQITVSQGDGSRASEGNQTLLFRSSKTYHGPASIALDVMDTESLNDDDQKIAQITVPIEVKPAVNVAPEVRSTKVEVEAGGDAVEIDLERLATDANDDDLTAEVTGADREVSGEVDGDTVEVQAGEDGKIGDTVRLELRVSDGEVDEPVVGTIDVTVVGSTKGLLSLVDPIAVEGEAGETSTIDLAPYLVSDPFPDEKKKVSDVERLSGEGSVDVEGTTFEVTPADGFSGVLAVGFVVDDGSGEQSREVAGRIEVTVADKPDAPGRPNAVADGADAVRLTWPAPDANGKPITEYRVTYAGGETSCPGTSCRVDGLDPGTEYTFTVAARNAVDWSEESPKSSPVTPDMAPEVMTAPVVDAATEHPSRDRKLELSWKEPANEGSKITSYQIQQSPGGIKDVSPGSLSTTISGLTNGTEYTFMIRAVNAKGEGPWSPPSDGSTPFTKPSQVASVTADPADADSDGKGYVDVTWSVAEDGGDPDGVSEYTVQLTGGGNSYEKTVSGTQTSTAFEGVKNGSEYVAKVKATNRAGIADAWGESAPVLVYDFATAPRAVSKVSDGDNTGVVKVTPPSDDGGLGIARYGYQLSTGQSGEVGASEAERGFTVNFGRNYDLSNPMSVEMWAIGSRGGTTAVSPNRKSSGAVFKPYGAPTIRDNGSSQNEPYTAVVRWIATPNGRPVDRVDYSDAANGSTSGASGEVRFDRIQGGTRCLNVVARSARTDGAEERSSSSARLCSKAQDRRVIITFREIGNTAPCSANCDAIDLRVEGFVPGDYRYTTNLRSSVDGSTPSGTISVGGDGRGSRQQIAVYNRNVYDETYCAYVDGVEGCAPGR